VSEDSESVDSVDSVDELSDASVVELSEDSVDELSPKTVGELLDESVEVESVDAGADESVTASAAPPENNPANTTAKTAKCFFTAVQSSVARRVCHSHRHQRSGRYTLACGDKSVAGHVLRFCVVLRFFVI
jgi:hypothetical protein